MGYRLAIAGEKPVTTWAALRPRSRWRTLSERWKALWPKSEAWAETVKYDGVAQHLQEVWIALRASLRGVLESVSLEDIAKGDLPGDVAELVAAPGAWVGR